MMLLSPALLAQAGEPTTTPADTFWLPAPSATAAPHVDTAFYFIYWVSVFFFVLVVALMLYFVIRYRRRVEGEPAPGGAHHNTALEITWSAIPLVLVVVMFYMGFRGFMDIVNPPANALDIHVLGQKWTWIFTYPNGHADTELHVPVDTPIRLILTSNDVIHSLYIREFRIKRDAVPGRYNKIWFRATHPGRFWALCTEYCGQQHSTMLAPVVVHEPGGYEKWLAAAADPFQTRSFAEVGAMLHQKRCSGCHSDDGRPHVGPTFKDLFGKTVQFADGTTAVADENYIRESMVNPNAKIVAGYPNVMPTFKGQLKDSEITAIIEYIKELSGAATAVPVPDPAPEPAP